MTKKPTTDKNLARTLSWRFRWLTSQVVAAKPKSVEEALALLGKLFNDIWGRSKTTEQLQAELFSFGPWDDCLPAVLEACWLPLPAEMVPDSREALIKLCENLLDRTGDTTLRDRFLAGWRTRNSNKSADTIFKEFCKDLWKTRRTDPHFFSAVVRGMHGTALVYPVRKEASRELTRVRAVRLVSNMALVWAAHDVQATVAAARLSKTRPLAGLVGGLAKNMKADTVFAASRPAYKIATLAISKYRPNEKIRQGKPEAKLSKHDDVVTIRENLPETNRAAFADFVGIDKDREPFSRRRRDRFLQDLPRALEQQSPEFWAELKKPTGRFAGMTMSQVWYRGLKPSEMSALAAIRLVFWEERLHAHISGLTNKYWEPGTYKPKESGWKMRVADLVHNLHRVILHKAGPLDGDDVPGHDYTHIDNAEKFITDALNTGLPTDGIPMGRMKTCFDLDVCVATRLTR